VSWLGGESSSPYWGPTFSHWGWAKSRLQGEGGAILNWTVESFVWCLWLMGPGQGRKGVALEVQGQQREGRRQPSGGPLGTRLT
jgi:hypothetical protein